MPTVSELKTQARRAEQEGDLVEAIAIYQHILHHLAEWPDALAEELNLFTRVGDLRVELHQPARAYAAYRQAAEQYARLGSTDDLKLLCRRMINVVPASADAYAHFAKRLLHHGHLKEAVDLVREYAGKAGLQDVTHTVNALEGRSNGETRALLADLLDTIERDWQGHAVAARRVLEELANETAPEAGRVDVVTLAKVSDPRTKPQQTEPKPLGAVTPPASPVTGRAPAPVGPRPAPPPSTRQSPPLPAASAPPASPPAATSERPATAATKSRPASANFNWRPVGVGGAIAAAVGLLIVAVVKVSGGDGEAPSPEAMAARVDTSHGAVDTDSLGLSSSQGTAEADAPVTPQQAPSPPPQPEPVQPDPVQPEPIQESPQTEPPELEPEPITVDTTASDTTIAEVDSSAVITEPLVVGDLPIQSVSPSEFRGQAGFRVVHILDSGAEFIVESYPVDSTSASRYPIGSVIVNNIPPDTTVSIVRFDDRYLVFASGTVPEDSARVLIDLLRLRESSF